MGRKGVKVKKGEWCRLEGENALDASICKLISSGKLILLENR